MMALTIDPETGQPTTTGILAARDEDRERRRIIETLDRAILDDAVRWRALPQKVRDELVEKYNLG